MTLFIGFLISFYFPVDSWQSEILEELQVRGEYIPNTGVKPFDIAIDDPGFDRIRSKFGQPIISVSGQFDTLSVVRIKPSLVYSWGPFSMYMQPVFKFGEDSLPPKKKFMDTFSSHYERAYVRFQSQYVDLFVGRERFVAGPSLHNNLLLSGHSAPMDFLGYTLKGKTFALAYLISRLDDLTCKPLEYVGDTISSVINASRYLTVKRLDVKIAKGFYLGLMEAGIFGGEHYSLELYHFNPIVLLQAYQYNWNKDVNFFFQFDAKWYYKNMCIYGALVMDDFQMEEDPNNEPHHLAYTLGFETVDPFKISKTFWILEYTAVTRFTYTHFIPYQRYQYLSTPIGSPHGPDHDEIFGKIVYHIHPAFDVYTHLSYLRQGNTHIDDGWPIPENPRVPGTFFPEDNFLNDPVEHVASFQLGFRIFLKRYLAADIALGMQHIENLHHIPDESSDHVILKMQLHSLSW